MGRKETWNFGIETILTFSLVLTSITMRLISSPYTTVGFETTLVFTVHNRYRNEKTLQYHIDTEILDKYILLQICIY